MLEIRNGETGALVLLTNKELHYIKYSTKNPGVLIQARTSEEAIGISIHGETYNINGGTELEGRPSAVIREVDDSAEYVFSANVKANEAGEGVTVVTSGLLELDENTSAEIAELREAILEIDASISE